MAVGPITLKGMRARDHAPALPRLGVRVAAAFILTQLLLLGALMLAFPTAAGAAAVKGVVSVSTAGGYARIIFSLTEDVDADVRLAGGIVIVQFKQPVDVPVERIPMLATGYVAAARSDPDGTGVRMALNRKVTRSVRRADLISEASWNHCNGPGKYWFRHGCRPLSNVVRCTVPLFSGIQTVFVSQNVDTAVPAGAFAGNAVEPHGINGCPAGL